MTHEAEHLTRADAALQAAKALQRSHSAWALVPLFYSAMHVMHACFDRDALPADQRHPGGHKSRWSNGARVSWGTTDVVRALYPTRVSRLYNSLFDAGHATRYRTPPPGDGTRLWQEYDTLRRIVGQ